MKNSAEYIAEISEFRNRWNLPRFFLWNYVFLFGFLTLFFCCNLRSFSVSWLENKLWYKRILWEDISTSPNKQKILFFSVLKKIILFIQYDFWAYWHVRLELINLISYTLFIYIFLIYIFFFWSIYLLTGASNIINLQDHPHQLCGQLNLLFLSN